MKDQNKEKERDICVVGRPDLEQLSKDEQQAFFDTLLLCVIEYFNRDLQNGVWILH